MAARVKLYTMDFCPFCERAKALLKQRGVDFEEIRVAYEDDAMWDDLERRSGMKTMPQIFDGEKVIGGYNELASLDGTDRLASLKG